MVKVDARRPQSRVADKVHTGTAVEMVRPGAGDKRVVAIHPVVEIAARRAGQRVGRKRPLMQHGGGRGLAPKIGHHTGRPRNDRKARQRQKAACREIRLRQGIAIGRQHRQKLRPVLDHDPARDRRELQLLKVAQEG